MEEVRKRVSLEKLPQQEAPDISERLIKTHGTFHCAFRHEKLMLMITGGLTVVLFAALIARLGTDCPGLAEVLYGVADFIDMMIDGVVGIVTGTIFAAINAGRFYRCELTDDAFIVTDGRGRREYFYYREITDIRWEEMKRLGGRRGWEVTIETEIKTVVYPVIFKSDVYTDITDTPFYYLMLNTGIADVKRVVKRAEETIADANGEEYSPLEQAFVAQYQAARDLEREQERERRRENRRRRRWY